MSATVEVDGLTKRYSRSAAPAVEHASLRAEAGTFTCLLGPSGSGKSTVLACIAGLVEPDAGTITVGGAPMAGVPAHRRSVTLLMQSAQLFGFLTVADNVAFGLKVRGLRATHRAARAAELLELVGLAGYGERDPRSLSGGEQQRVALARALAVEPEVLLLDEPLASLDPPVRRDLQDELVALHRRVGTTMVLVTHDLAEALALADHVVVMERGEVSASGPASSLYERPPTLGVARLMGIDTVLVATRSAGRLTTALGEIDGVAPPHSSPRATFVVRPEHVAIAPLATDAAPPAPPWHLQARAAVTACRYQGTTTLVQLDAGGTALWSLVPAAAAPRPGELVLVRVAAHHLVEVDPAGQTAQP